VTSKRLRVAGLVGRMKKTTRAYIILARKTLEKIPLGRVR
jgi:hypothetical protein